MSDDRYLQSLGVKPDAEARELLFVVREEESANIGVLSNKTENASGVMRDERGRLLPGSRIPGSGRKSKAYESQLVESLRKALPPDKLEWWIDKALKIAEYQQSARGIIAVLEFATSYAAGKPVQQVVRDTGKTELLEQLLTDDKPLLPDVEPTETQDKNG